MRPIATMPARPEESRTVRQAVTERLVAEGFNRRHAERLAEASYRRVETMIEEKDRTTTGAAGGIAHR